MTLAPGAPGGRRRRKGAWVRGPAHGRAAPGASSARQRPSARAARSCSGRGHQVGAHEKPLAIGGHRILGLRRPPGGGSPKQLAGLADVQHRNGRHLDHHHVAVGTFVKELPVRCPRVLVPAPDRHRRLSARTRERPDVDLARSRLIGPVGDVASVGREDGTLLRELSSEPHVGLCSRSIERHHQLVRRIHRSPSARTSTRSSSGARRGLKYA